MKKICIRCEQVKSVSEFYRRKKPKEVELSAAHFNSLCKVCKNKAGCLFCGKLLCAKDNRQEFCNRSCSASYNNKKYPKRGDGTKRVCVGCGGLKNLASLKCQKCHHMKFISDALKKPMSRFLLKGNARFKYNPIRKIGRRIFDLQGGIKKCRVCGFDAVVHIDHIRPLSTFSDEALMADATGMSNLQCLCPNHHAMKERGLLQDLLV